MEESELVLRLRNRDKSALSYLYDKYNAALYGVASRIIKNDDITDEVLQDVFVKIWNKIDKYDASKGRFFTWMMNLTRNAAIDKLRSKEISRSSKTDSIDDYVYTFDRENSTEMSTDAIGVKTLMDSLVEDQKFILQKIYFEGFTHAEIAEEYDIPLGTVKSRLRSALNHMRKRVA
ncbi:MULTISPECIES: RNA polymerase sigma factor [Roseivirga]|uniref:RNA polymerase n=1 Tax=Roseivirga spongicola TaxID=333140 RepID=A0A150XI57_9BACT|nr:MULTISPECIES: sigma-70 family RNA polymerase sigma factor [Roseivirga]PWL31146.1 MAG: RNA polymerase [Roseivirga sp. XM-24bin3]KYG78409.1 RNA polymerase [Roseivirga spongicola]MBO6497333.1 sigma-70 family RNA polymerase sigma factor [Roseivirga sp.]MBO6660768.1 sigma-70 family RNA polymerase sigma factor [Roseivirga sp.]MBO6762420.1 sigma-70 family RNA polymerase sigma factor [Roseivirga sp.]